MLLSSLVGWLGFNGPLRQYFSLYRAVSQREGERGEESKNDQTTPTCTYCKHNRPLPYYHPSCRMPRHWKLTQDHHTTRPPHPLYNGLTETVLLIGDNKCFHLERNLEHLSISEFSSECIQINMGVSMYNSADTIACEICIIKLTLKAPSKNCSRQHFIFLLLSF